MSIDFSQDYEAPLVATSFTPADESEFSLRDLRRADPPAEAVVLVPERPFSASRCSVFSDPYLAPQPGCQD